MASRTWRNFLPSRKNGIFHEQIRQHDSLNLTCIRTTCHSQRQERRIKEIIESFNGSVSESVSKNTDIVIVGSNPGSKYQDALKLNIMIWDNDKTIEVLNNLPKA